MGWVIKWVQWVGLGCVWVSCWCRPGIAYVSFRCCLGVVWVSCWCRVGAMWVLCGCCVGVVWVPYGCCVGHGVGVIWVVSSVRPKLAFS